MHILLLSLMVSIYPAYNLAMDRDKMERDKAAIPATISTEISRSQSTNYGESPDPGSALNRHSLGKSVSPERARTPALPSANANSSAKREYANYKQVMVIEASISTLRQKVLEIFGHTREDKYIMGSKELHQRLTKHMQDEESLLEFLEKSPTPAEYAAHILKTSTDTALEAWQKLSKEPLNMDEAFIKEKIKDVQEEITATHIAFHINEQQQQRNANCSQCAP